MYYYIGTAVSTGNVFCSVQIEKEITWSSDAFLRSTERTSDMLADSYARGRQQRLAKNICARALQIHCRH